MSYDQLELKNIRQTLHRTAQSPHILVKLFQKNSIKISEIKC